MLVDVFHATQRVPSERNDREKIDNKNKNKFRLLQKMGCVPAFHSQQYYGLTAMDKILVAG